MKVLIATLLVIVAMIDAEPTRFHSFARQTIPAEERPAPYEASGYRPQGAAFRLPQKLQQTYGPPPPAYGPPNSEPTTTEIPTTTYSETEETPTEQPQVDRLRDGRKSARIQQNNNNKPVYLVVPQNQNYFYPAQQSARLVAVPQTGILNSLRAPISSFYSPYTYFQIY